jgi:hypothetical protein
MHDTFEARNELEQGLVAAREEPMPGNAFMQYQLETQVFLPVKDPVGIEGFPASDKAVPLTLQAEDGIETLVLLTSPGRAGAFPADYPGYEGGLLVGIQWVLERTGTGIGIAINPDWPVGTDLAPDMVRQRREN